MGRSQIIHLRQHLRPSQMYFTTRSTMFNLLPTFATYVSNKTRILNKKNSNLFLKNKKVCIFKIELHTVHWAPNLPFSSADFLKPNALYRLCGFRPLSCFAESIINKTNFLFFSRFTKNVFFFSKTVLSLSSPFPRK